MSSKNRSEVIPNKIVKYCRNPFDKNLVGFYFSFYWLDPSSISTSLEQTLATDVDETKKTFVSECVYIRMVENYEIIGYVFRRAKIKNGKLEHNNYYKSDEFKCDYRFKGHYSTNEKVFFGIWLDPHQPFQVAGTVRMRFYSDGWNGKPMLSGEWDGIKTKAPNADSLLGYEKVFGRWQMFKIGNSVKELEDWVESLIRDGDKPDNPEIFLAIMKN